MSGPLEGLVVLDLTRLQPGNYATMVMGDLGADVIKIEEPGRGDYVRWTPPMVGDMSAMHRVLNRNKRSVTLNLKNPKGAELLLKMVEGADVLIESFRPGVMDRLGVGYDALSQRNPGLIYAAITGYGQDGPYKDRAGHDLNYLAYGGVLGTGGVKEGPPVLPSVQVADLSGAMMAVIGVLSALHKRQSTGEGELIDVGMMDVAISWLALHVAPWFAGAEPLRRGEGYLNGGFPFYRVYECKDGGYMSVGALEPQFWAALCNALEMPELVGEQFSDADRQRQIHKLLEEKFLTKTRDEWTAALAGIDACVAPVNDFPEMAEDPQVVAREMMNPAPTPEAPSWRDLGVAVKLRRNPGSLSKGAPGLGEHNQEVYGGLGLSSDEVQTLSGEGAI